MAAWRGVLGLGLLCLLPVAGERGAEGRGVAGAASGAGGGGRRPAPVPVLKEGWRAPASLSEAALGTPDGFVRRRRGCVRRGGPAEAPGTGEPLASSRTPQPWGAEARQGPGCVVLGGHAGVEVGGANGVH